VNQTFARRFLPGRVVGQTIAVHLDGPSSPLQSLTIVGVVEDSMYRFVKETPPPTVFLSLPQMTQPAPASINLSARAKGAQTASVSRSVADAIGGVDSDVSLTFRLLTEQVSA